MPARKQVNTPKKPAQKRVSANEIAKELSKNNLTLQSKIVDLVKTNNDLLQTQTSLMKSQTELTNEVKAMVGLFKEAGQHMVAETEEERLKPLLGRISELVEQNKTIMRGLILIQKFIKTTTPETPVSRPLSPEF